MLPFRCSTLVSTCQKLTSGSRMVNLDDAYYGKCKLFCWAPRSTGHNAKGVSYELN